MARPRQILLPLLLAAAVQTPARAIVGDSAPAAQRGGVMVLSAGGGRAGFCSGVALGPHIVLTAAHCVSAPSATRVHYRDASGASVLVEATQVERHPRYRANAVAARAPSVDLALVSTRTPLPESLSASQIGEGPQAVGDNVVVAGFGVMREGRAETSGQWRAAAMRLRAPLSHLLLWLEGAGGACTGDSGGPVFVGSSLVAIVAFAEGAGAKACGKLTQAVRLAPHRAWIDATIARWR